MRALPPILKEMENALVGVQKSEGQEDGRGKLQESKGEGDIELPLLRKDRGGKPNETNKPARKEGRRSSKVRHSGRI